MPQPDASPARPREKRGPLAPPGPGVSAGGLRPPTRNLWSRVRLCGVGRGLSGAGLTSRPASAAGRRQSRGGDAELSSPLRDPFGTPSGRGRLWLRLSEGGNGSLERLHLSPRTLLSLDISRTKGSHQRLGVVSRPHACSQGRVRLAGRVGPCSSLRPRALPARTRRGPKGCPAPGRPGLRRLESSEPLPAGSRVDSWGFANRCVRSPGDVDLVLTP